jgi:flagellar biosynthetic protein FliQ
MTGQEVMDISQEGVWLLLKISLPLLLIALIVGLAISLFQALTQIQEMTLTFVPKIIAILFGLIFFRPLMSEMLNSFVLKIFDRIVGLT